MGYRAAPAAAGEFGHTSAGLTTPCWSGFKRRGGGHPPTTAAGEFGHTSAGLTTPCWSGFKRRGGGHPPTTAARGRPRIVSKVAVGGLRPTAERGPLDWAAPGCRGRPRIVSKVAVGGLRPTAERGPLDWAAPGCRGAARPRKLRRPGWGRIPSNEFRRAAPARHAHPRGAPTKIAATGLGPDSFKRVSTCCSCPSRPPPRLIGPLARQPHPRADRPWAAGGAGDKWPPGRADDRPPRAPAAPACRPSLGGGRRR